MDNTNSKGYWNEYVSYWENKVQEANSEKEADNKTNSDKILEFFLQQMNVQEKDKLLDYGCGSGRLFSIYSKLTDSKNYYGIDIAKVCLEHAEEKWEELNINQNLFEFDGLKIPFENNTFEKIVCFGVLDACNQENTVKELARVLKVGGLCLLTGKNNNYYNDDEEAMIAEINARKKEHPNYFTDVTKLLEELKKLGIEIVENYYFARRGDLTKLNYVKEKKDIFYEWVLLLKKTTSYKDVEISKFSNAYSNTYLKKNESSKLV